MNNTAKVGAAVVGGYLMGRSKKAKLAFALGTWMMGKRLSLDPSKLAREGLSTLTSSPEVARLTGEVRQELLGAGKAAAMTMFTERVEKLADSLHQRTAAMAGAQPEQPEGGGEEDREENGEEDREEDREENGEENGEEDGEEEHAEHDGGERERGEQEHAEQGRGEGADDGGEEPEGPRLQKRTSERHGAERPHRRPGRSSRQPSETERPAVRAGSRRGRGSDGESPPPRRRRPDADDRRTAAEAARSRS